MTKYALQLNNVSKVYQDGENENTVFELKDFNYMNKSKKYRLVKKYAKRKGFKYIKRMYLPTKVLMLESTKDIKSQIDMIGE